MAIVISNGVSNIANTPGIITDVIENRPSATTVAIGTIFISTNTQAIFTNVANAWVQVGKG
jgi:hypothetical protein